MRPAFDWKFVATTLLAIAGVAVPIFLWQYDLASSRSLSVQLTSSVALQPETDSAVDGLQVTVDGTKVDSPYLSNLALTNDGSRPILASEFDSPLVVTLNSGAKIVRARVSTTKPNKIPAVVDSDEHSIRLKPLLLNPGDSLSLAVLTAGGRPTFSPAARIVGISKIAYDDNGAEENHPIRAAIEMVVALVSVGVYMIYGVYLIYPGPVIIRRYHSLATMFACAMGGSLAFRRALQAVNLDDNKTALAGTVLVVGICGLAGYRHLSARRRALSSAGISSSRW
jgi:hypothetical protein